MHVSKKVKGNKTKSKQQKKKLTTNKTEQMKRKTKQNNK